MSCKAGGVGMHRLALASYQRGYWRRGRLEVGWVWHGNVRVAATGPAKEER